LRKAFFPAFIVVSIIMILSACAGDGEPVENDTSTDGKGDDDSLVVAIGSDVTEIDPHLAGDIPTANIFHEKIFETLVTQDQDMEFQPNLATDWERVDDLTWKFTLREDVQFHDGEPFNAEAVQQTLERVVDDEIASPREDLFTMIDEINIIDDYTIEFVTEYPFSPLLAHLAHYAGGMISPKAIEDFDGDDPLEPIGTGPFEYDSRQEGSEVTLVKNEDYWGEDVNIDKVTFQVVNEGQSRLAMVEAGEAHIAEPINVNNISQVEQSEEMDLYRTEGLGMDYVGFNMTKAPFDDKRVRQAINYAIDKEQMVESVYNGVGLYADGPIGPAVLGYDSELEGYEYDPEKAKELLEEAGYPDGFETKIWTNDSEARQDVAENVQSQLSEVGIDVEIELLEWGAYLEATEQGDHDMFVLGWSNMTGDGDYNQYFVFHSDAHGAEGNRTFYENEKVDELIEGARKESDEDKRIKIYHELQQIEKEDAPLIYVRHLEHVAAVHKSVENFQIHPSNIMMLDDITINR